VNGSSPAGGPGEGAQQEQRGEGDRAGAGAACRRPGWPVGARDAAETGVTACHGPPAISAARIRIPGSSRAVSTQSAWEQSGHDDRVPSVDAGVCRSGPVTSPWWPRGSREEAEGEEGGRCRPRPQEVDVVPVRVSAYPPGRPMYSRRGPSAACGSAGEAARTAPARPPCPFFRARTGRRPPLIGDPRGSLQEPRVHSRTGSSRRERGTKEHDDRAGGVLRLTGVAGLPG